MLFEASGGLWPVLRTIAFGLTIALLFFGTVPLPTGPLPAGAAAVAPSTAVVRRGCRPSNGGTGRSSSPGNLAEAARELAHQAFASLGLTPTPEAPPPAVVVAGLVAVSRPPAGAARSAALWTSPPAARPAGFRRPRCEQLDAALRDLLDAVAAGRVRLADQPFSDITRVSEFRKIRLERAVDVSTVDHTETVS